MKDPIQTFLEGFEKSSTQRIYRGHLNNFFEWVGVPPTKYFNNGRDYNKDLLDFWNYTKNLAPCTRSGRITCIRQFLDENDIIINSKTWKVIKRQKKTIPKTIDHVPTVSELKSILSHAGVKERALFMCSLSSGFRIDEALEITKDDFRYKDEKGNLLSPAKIIIRQNVAKNDTPRITYVTDEARDMILEWLKIRDEYLIAAVTRLAKLHIPKKLDDDRLFPYAYVTAWNMWSRLLQKAGLDQKDKSTNRYEIHIHTLRKFFINRLNAVIRTDAVETLVGHEGYLSRSYRRLSEEELKDAYRNGMPTLSIFEKQPDLSDVNEKLQVKDQQIQDMQTQLNNLRLELLEVRLKQTQELQREKNKV